MSPAEKLNRKQERRQNTYIRARRDVRGIILFPPCVNNASELEEELGKISEEDRIIAGIYHEAEQGGGRASETYACYRAVRRF